MNATIASIIAKSMGITVIGLVGAGALVAFGWVFGEYVSTKIVDRIDARKDKKLQKNPA
ncbi:MAG: hypothetical protein HQM16_12010 [Deltaproteobacteria bacterium]|nr:hypothetical protein [Deltaproteobacteria bacterium]